MTISAARLNANRSNAIRSTGPVTQAGKDRVRLNAWKHGFRSESGLVGLDEHEAVTSRRAEWSGAFPTTPGDGYQAWLVDQLTLASVRIDRCQDHQRSQAIAEADRAANCWEVDREAEAAAIGARLGRDPDRVASRLCRSLAGLDWLLNRWRALGNLLNCEPGWDDDQRRLCLDLMRIPDEFREADRAMLANLPPDELRDLVREHIDGLESLRGSTSRVDASDRGLAEIGLPTSEASDLRRLRRFESALWRRFRSLESSWKAARSRDPDADDAEVDTDADPIGDLLSHARMIEAEPPTPTVPEPDPASLPRASAFPSPSPWPPPVRLPDRGSPAAPPSDPNVPAISSPRTATPVRLSLSSAPPILQNRRARRALNKQQRR